MTMQNVQSSMRYGRDVLFLMQQFDDNTINIFT